MLIVGSRDEILEVWVVRSSVNVGIKAVECYARITRSTRFKFERVFIENCIGLWSSPLFACIFLPLPFYRRCEQRREQPNSRAATSVVYQGRHRLDSRTAPSRPHVRAPVPWSRSWPGSTGVSWKRKSSIQPRPYSLCSKISWGRVPRASWRRSMTTCHQKSVSQPRASQSFPFATCTSRVCGSDDATCSAVFLLLDRSGRSPAGSLARTTGPVFFLLDITFLTR